ncbi:hypothetical protein ABKN59_005151 [Abortiporus biennis]
MTTVEPGTFESRCRQCSRNIARDPVKCHLGTSGPIVQYSSVCLSRIFFRLLGFNNNGPPAYIEVGTLVTAMNPPTKMLIRPESLSFSLLAATYLPEFYLGFSSSVIKIKCINNTGRFDFNMKLEDFLYIIHANDSISSFEQLEQRNIVVTVILCIDIDSLRAPKRHCFSICVWFPWLLSPGLLGCAPLAVGHCDDRKNPSWRHSPVFSLEQVVYRLQSNIARIGRVYYATTSSNPSFRFNFSLGPVESLKHTVDDSCIEQTF